MKAAIDTVIVYKFIKKLTTPFEKWDAYKNGIIDKKGNIVKKRSKDDSFTKFDILVLNIKKILEKLPGGSTRIASYAAALYLIKENREVFISNNISSDIMFEMEYNNKHFIGFVEQMVEDAPTNSVGSGNIAGTTADTYTPALHPRHVKKHKKRTSKNDNDIETGRKIL